VAPVIPAGPKLSIEQIDQLRERYALGGLRQVDLAFAYGVSQSVVSRAVRGAYGA
jgi:predicted transcriptional regulator